MVKRALVDSPAVVCDVATGTAGVAMLLAAPRGTRVVGVDLTEAMLRRGKQNVTRAGAEGRIALTVGNAQRMPFASSTFDALTFTYLLRYVDDPPATVRELARVVRPGGRVASLEFGVPPWAPARAAWRLYTAAGLPALGRLASREWGQVGRFLGPSIRGFYARHPLERIVGYWRDAGLEDVRVRRMSLGGGVVMWASKRAGGGARES